MLIDGVDVANLLGLHAVQAERVYVLGGLQASASLVRLKGPTWYAGASGQPRAMLAEALLCLYHALPLVSLRLDALGAGVETQRWETLPDGTRVQTAYASLSSMEGLRGALREQAYLLVDGDVGVDVGAVDPRSGLVEGLGAGEVFVSALTDRPDVP